MDIICLVRGTLFYGVLRQHGSDTLGALSRVSRYPAPCLIGLSTDLYLGNSSPHELFLIFQSELSLTRNPRVRQPRVC